MRLEHLYRLRFSYPDGWAVELEGGWQQHLYFADGVCEGALTGRFRAANFPLRRTAEGPFLPDLRGVVETDDGATVLVECRGYGRAQPAGARQVVGSVLHVSDHPSYRRLNDAVCVCVGEVRARDGDGPELVLDVAEVIWEPIAP
ncbi:hypothetical protein R8Z57_17265 [Microbacterium sp. M3]|uniref:Uncharacterized protein n=1 Tax=Microbacterium arthrosphaerae TaxID=792652 RepID=A0ABU4H5A6_9MICO|nr:MULTISPECIES: hypothetical protein [Microbacterium]MDW4574528.1 hypothetical protein [Microbacterium arthrosphaerae]MDW7608383.1 hypothetical protein [Microbacterium sp. M3]